MGWSVCRQKVFRTSFELILRQIFRTFWTKPQAINNPKLLHWRPIFHIFRKELYKHSKRSSILMVFAGQIFRFLDFYCCLKIFGHSKVFGNKHFRRLIFLEQSHVRNFLFLVYISDSWKLYLPCCFLAVTGAFILKRL